MPPLSPDGQSAFNDDNNNNNMAPDVAVAAPPSGITAHRIIKLPQSHSQHIETVVDNHDANDDNDSTIKTVDELLRRRARTSPDRVIVAYPKHGIVCTNYTYRQLDVFAFRVAKHLEAFIPSRRSSAEKRSVVAMLGPSNLEYLATLQALIKLGHTILFLSTRIPAPAIASLVKDTGASHVLADPKFVGAANAVQGEMAKLGTDLQVLDMPTRDVFEFPVDVHVDTQLDAHLDAAVETEQIVYIIHSSGSTGFPKPIYQKQGAALHNYADNMNLRAFITLPLYHNHGLCNLYRAIWSRKSIHWYNADLPLTYDYLVQMMREHNFEIFYGVPYALKLLAEQQEGIRLLADMKMVMYGGSACPDDLGDLLVSQGVHLISHYGATEVGGLMTSARAPGDKAWNYVREHAKLKPYLRWIPQGPNLFECAVKPGWPAKTATNMDDGGYHTKDLFEPHPTVPGAWKYIARLDDTIVLVNGEKFNPVTTEGSIRSSKLVAECIIFGAQQPYLGVLIVPAPGTLGKSGTELAELLWPVVEHAQRDNEAHARLSREMMVVLPHGTEYPRTDKGSVIRQAFYKQFAPQIELAYANANSLANENAREMSREEIMAFLRGLVQTSLARLTSTPPEFDDDTDFFALGLDSLQSIQLRVEIVKAVKTKAKLTQNVVFEHPSINKLTAYLVGGASSQQQSVEEEMQALVDKYTAYLDDLSREIPAAPAKKAPSGSRTVAVTGATGSLGAHIVASLAQDPAIARIYAFNRAQDTKSAARRTTASLMARKLWHCLPLEARRKIVSLPVDLSRKDLGLGKELYDQVLLQLCDSGAVIHAAWSVNFNLQLSSFEKDNIAGVAHLLALSRASRAAFSFCSSVSAVARHPNDIPVPEVAPQYEWAQGMGYAQSKSVAENLCARAAGHSPVRVLRIGQIVADTVHGLWNATEGVPLSMQTALTIGALPSLKNETPSWLPVDVVGKTVVEIALASSPSSDAAAATFTNITNHRTFSWDNDLLPSLRAAGITFDVLAPREWIARLRASNPDPKTNAPIKLVDFFASKYDKEPDEILPSKQYATDVARSLSPTLAGAPVADESFVRRFVDQFLATSWGNHNSSAQSAAAAVVMIVTGPCGSGKTMLASALARDLGVPFVEGDSLHTRAAVEAMRSGRPLGEEERGPWLARVVRRVEQELGELGWDGVAVSCSGLKKAHRDGLRTVKQGGGSGAKVVFLDLQAMPETLVERVRGREGHYMTPELVQSQLETYEAVGVEEADVYPVDAERPMEDVVEEAKWALDMMKKSF